MSDAPRRSTRARKPANGSRDADPSPEAGFDFGSPRWREPNAGDELRASQRRFRNTAAPDQRGSIDAADSVARKAPSKPRSTGDPA